MQVLSRYLCILLVLPACLDLNQVLGDRVNLSSYNSHVVPILPGDVNRTYYGRANGKYVGMTAKSDSTGWFHIRSHYRLGWTTKRYFSVDETDDEPESADNSGHFALDTLRNKTDNIEHFRFGSIRGSPENVNGEPTYSTRTSENDRKASKLIGCLQDAKLIVQNEIYGPRNEFKKVEVDYHTRFFNGDRSYTIGKQGGSELVTMEWDTNRIGEETPLKIAIAKKGIGGRDFLYRFLHIRLI